MNRLLIAALLLSAPLAAQTVEEDDLAEFQELAASFADPAEGWVDLFASGLSGWAPQSAGVRVPRPWDWQPAHVIKLDPSNPARLLHSLDGPPGFMQKPAETSRTVAWVTNYPGTSANLTTRTQFADTELYVEFLVSKGANGGVALMGLYEIQIFDSYGKEVKDLKYGDNGAIYAMPKVGGGRTGGRAPQVNVSRPPGEWQSFHIWFQAPKFGKDGKKVQNGRFIRVEHNGTVIHENYELIAPTRADNPWPPAPRRPLLLQGDHGPVAYRNAFIRELKQP